jgi:hypothetical protein
VLAAISTIVVGIVFPDTTSPAAATSALNIAMGVVGVVGAFLALLGLPAVYAHRAREGGVIWLLGVVLIALTAVLFGIFMGLMGVLVFPILAVQAPTSFAQGPPESFIGVFIIGLAANFFGALLMGVPMLTRGIYPRWCGYMMLLEAVLAVVGFFVNGPTSSGVLSQILNVVSPLPLFVVLGWIGVQLTSSSPSEPEVRVAASVTQPA